MIRRLARRALRQVAFAGRRRTCPVCGRCARLFLAAGVVPRPDAACPWCGSLERHRFAWLYLQREAELLRGPTRLLHLAPERSLRAALDHLAGFTTVTADLDPTGVEVAADLTALPFPEAMFDAVYCSHVLEHVMDDRSAMHEVRRVLRPNGLAVVQVPLRNGETYEDGSITTPEGREAAFGQHDHVRVYGRDIVYRLESSGFQVEALTASKLFDPEAVRRHGLDPEDVLFRCVRVG